MTMQEKDFDKLESLTELYEAIEMGLDIEFVLYGIRYNISWGNYKPFICTCPDGEAIPYENAKDMLENHRVNGKPLKDIWQDVKILAM